jgi:hypothetical protein
MKFSGTYTPQKWEEKPYDVFENRMKSTKTTATFSFEGDFVGTAQVEYLMFYKSFDEKDSHKAAAQYVGLLKFVGSLKGKAGSFVATDNGVYESGAAQSNLLVISGSGTGELAKISGSGRYKADQSGCQWNLEVAY